MKQTKINLRGLVDQKSKQCTRANGGEEKNFKKRHQF